MSGDCCQKATRFYQVLTAKGQKLEAGVIKSASQVAGKRRVRRIYSLEAQFVQRQAKSIFQGAPLRCALGLRQSGVESCHAYPALSDTTPRGTRGGVARTGLLSAVPLCGTGAIMVRVYRQPDERLSTQRPERLTRTFNYTLLKLPEQKSCGRVSDVYLRDY